MLNKLTREPIVVSVLSAEWWHCPASVCVLLPIYPVQFTKDVPSRMSGKLTIFPLSKISPRIQYKLYLTGPKTGTDIRADDTNFLVTVRANWP